MDAHPTSPAFSLLKDTPLLTRSGLQHAFDADPNREKVFLGGGSYRDVDGELPRLASVSRAERSVLEPEPFRGYLDYPGHPPFADAIARLLRGLETEAPAAPPVRVVQTPGGSAALYLGGVFLRTRLGRNRIWLSDPTWGNHIRIFRTAGLSVSFYPCYDAPTKTLPFDRFVRGLEAIPRGDAVLLQSCCHNPTGLDPSPDQWDRVAAVVEDRQLVPFFDTAFFGFSAPPDEELQGLRTVCAKAGAALWACSFSKSFALYNERVGGLAAIGHRDEELSVAYRHLVELVRGTWSNPPWRGAAIVAEVLLQADLRSAWLSEMASVRSRLHRLREGLARHLHRHVPERDFSYMVREEGVFTRLDLTSEAVASLRREHGIYLSDSAIFNVSRLPDEDLDGFARKLAPDLRWKQSTG